MIFQYVSRVFASMYVGGGGGCAQAYKNNDNVFIGDIYLCVFTKSYKYINNVMLYILIISAMVLK